MRNLTLRRILTATIAVAVFITPTALSGRVPDSVPSQYTRFFKRATDTRSLPERMLNLAGFTGQTYGRSFALVVGISRYPNISGDDGNLAPAREDVRKATEYLRTYEHFDEIVVLEDNDVTIGNLAYFLEIYFPSRLRAFPRSRFLFVYSGHGMTEKTKGYLLTSSARSVTDRDNVIGMATLRAMFQEVVDSGYHVLALINACYSGAFFRKPFGPAADYVPKNPGAHAITAGGTSEKTWHQGDLGSGSVFFEMFFAALNGRASTGTVITVSELTAYLQRHISSFTDQKQNPLGSDLSPFSSTGGFFFYNRAPLVANGTVPAWNPSNAKAFGVGPQVSADKPRSADSGEAHFADVDLYGIPPPPSRPSYGVSGFSEGSSKSEPRPVSRITGTAGFADDEIPTLAKRPSAKRSGSSYTTPPSTGSSWADQESPAKQKVPRTSGSSSFIR
jgi:caspase domain-containing protein